MLRLAARQMPRAMCAVAETPDIVSELKADIANIKAQLAAPEVAKGYSPEEFKAALEGDGAIDMAMVSDALEGLEEPARKVRPHARRGANDLHRLLQFPRQNYASPPFFPARNTAEAALPSRAHPPPRLSRVHSASQLPRRPLPSSSVGCHDGDRQGCRLQEGHRCGDAGD